MKKKLAAFFLVVIFIVSLLYLGGRTIQHEVLMRQQQGLILAESHREQIKSSIESLLNQQASHFSAVAQFLTVEQHSIDNLIQTDTDIKNIFVIQQSKVIYLTNGGDTQWLQLVESIEYDNSILFSHDIKVEQYQPKFGWYQAYDHLIYWVVKSDTIIGFELSNINFSLNLIKLFDEQSLSDDFTLTDNGKLIYSNGEQKSNSLIMSLNYPLQNWQLTYYYQQNSLFFIYLFGGGVMGLFIIGIIAIIIYCYRQYTQTLRLAMQQVSFVGQVSHEFKTPLTNITLYSEMLKEYLEDEEEPIPHYLDVITSESKRLTRLIQNVLNFNQLPKLNIKPVNLNQLIQRIHATFQPILAAKSLQLNLIATDNNKDFMINTDADSVMQIINNFLNNAEKYAADGGQVDLSIDKQDKQIVITVRDYGHGIASHLLRQIFKPFYRINSSLTEGVSGTGIGLTIAAQLAGKLNATIEVKNCNPGVAFSLRLTE